MWVAKGVRTGETEACVSLEGSVPEDRFRGRYLPPLVLLP